MYASSLAIYFIAITFLTACSPTYDWRQAQMEAVPLSVLLPCKPDRATRSVNFGNGKLDIQMLGCEAGKATFTVATAQLADPTRLADMLALWQQSTRVQLQAGPATPAEVQPLTLAGATPIAGTQRLLLRGKAADGSLLTTHVAWFTQGARVFQAAIYVQGDAAALPADALDSFFTGLKLQ